MPSVYFLKPSIWLNEEELKIEPALASAADKENEIAEIKADWLADLKEEYILYYSRYLMVNLFRVYGVTIAYMDLDVKDENKKMNGLKKFIRDHFLLVQTVQETLFIVNKEKLYQYPSILDVTAKASQKRLRAVIIDEYFEGGNVCIVKSQNGDTFLLHGEDPIGYYRQYEQTDNNLDPRTAPWKTVPDQATQSLRNHLQADNINVLGIQLSDKVIEDMYLHCCRLYHLDCFMVSIGKQLVLLNQEILSKASLDALRAEEIEILDLAYPLPKNFNQTADYFPMFNGVALEIKHAMYILNCFFGPYYAALIAEYIEEQDLVFFSDRLPLFIRLQLERHHIICVTPDALSLEKDKIDLFIDELKLLCPFMVLTQETKVILKNFLVSERIDFEALTSQQANKIESYITQNEDIFLGSPGIKDITEIANVVAQVNQQADLMVRKQVACYLKAAGFFNVRPDTLMTKLPPQQVIPLYDGSSCDAAMFPLFNRANEVNNRSDINPEHVVFTQEEGGVHCLSQHISPQI